MTIWASTGGSEEGRAAFHEWSAKAQEVRQGRDREALAALFQLAADRLGFGSLVYRARQADPNWRYAHAMDAGFGGRFAA